jgi:CRISPR-associated endonuclease/helicase Cas3
VLFFLALHDYGKIDIRFQFKSPKALQSLRPDFDRESIAPTQAYYHGPSGWEWFIADSPALGISELALNQWGEWMRAVCGHHGSLTLAGHFSRPLAEDEVIEFDAVARADMVRKLADFFLKPAGLALTSPLPPCPDLLAGFCSVCDWIGSNQNIFLPVFGRLLFTEYWHDEALKRAEVALGESGVFKQALLAGGMTELYPSYTPRQVQTLVDELPLEPGLTLIEAPTGSGKTEAAMAYASRLLAAGLADSVIFALPTQATANAMFTRLEEIAENLFPGGLNILLAHGRANYNPVYQALKSGLRITAQGCEEAAVECVKWLSSSRKRAFLGQIGVCTIDQAFLSVLPVRHQFVRAFGIRKSVLIIDEVHAYDAYMYGLLETVINGQKLAGGSAILLSATLPGWQKTLLLGKGDACGQGLRDAYPKITHTSHHGLCGCYVPNENQQPTPLSVTVQCWLASDLLPSEDQMNQILTRAAGGALVAIVCNLVDDAQLLAVRLRSKVKKSGSDIPVDLFHARYRFKDRQKKENIVMERYGKNATRELGRILVATQVVEQSLDLDFDWLITQLCPVDLMFQRIGRLHRHKREQRPEHVLTPLCTVLLPEAREYALHKVIYGHRQVLWRTQQLVQQHDRIDFPGAYRNWIERVYTTTPWPDEPADISEEAERFLEDAVGKFYGAKTISVIRGEPLPDTEGAAARLTRDGEMSLNLLLFQVGERAVLLDGEDLDELEEGDRDEMIDMNSVGVPASWSKWLPKCDDKGYVRVEMLLGDAETWLAEFGGHRLVHSAEMGLLHEEFE